MPTRAFWVAGAFLVGGIAGALAVYEGDLDFPSPASRTRASDVMLRIENNGTHAIDSTIEVMTVSGVSVWQSTILVPANDAREYRLPASLDGRHHAKGSFTWSDPPR